LWNRARSAAFVPGPGRIDAREYLRQPSNIMVDRIVTVRREKCGGVIGRLGQSAMLSLNRTLALVVGIAD
jgi:mRNA interferase MazF